jgi:hypothetical protein
MYMLTSHILEITYALSLEQLKLGPTSYKSRRPLVGG